MSAWASLIAGLVLTCGIIWAADAHSASVRQVARSGWGFAVYLIGAVLVTVGLFT